MNDDYRGPHALASRGSAGRSSNAAPARRSRPVPPPPSRASGVVARPERPQTPVRLPVTPLPSPELSEIVVEHVDCTPPPAAAFAERPPVSRFAAIAIGAAFGLALSLPVAYADLFPERPVPLILDPGETVVQVDEARPAQFVASAPASRSNKARKARKAVRRSASTTRRARRAPAKADSMAAAMRTLRRRLRSCTSQQSGSALLRLSVQPTGKISHVNVYGSQLDGRAESCMARAARGVHLPAQSGGIRRIEHTLSW